MDVHLKIYLSTSTQKGNKKQFTLRMSGHLLETEFLPDVDNLKDKKIKKKAHIALIYLATSLLEIEAKNSTLNCDTEHHFYELLYKNSMPKTQVDHT